MSTRSSDMTLDFSLWNYLKLHVCKKFFRVAKEICFYMLSMVIFFRYEKVRGSDDGGHVQHLRSCDHRMPLLSIRMKFKRWQSLTSVCKWFRINSQPEIAQCQNRWSRRPRVFCTCRFNRRSTLNVKVCKCCWSGATIM